MSYLSAASCPFIDSTSKNLYIEIYFYNVTFLFIKNEFFFEGLGFELRALCLQCRHATARLTPAVQLTREMGSHKLFDGRALNQNPPNLSLPSS
jgi:hypothetical protein